MDFKKTISRLISLYELAQEECLKLPPKTGIRDECENDMAALSFAVDSVSMRKPDKPLGERPNLRCPTCNSSLNIFKVTWPKYCPYCGKAIDYQEVLHD